MKVLFDSNVIVAAFLSEGLCARLIQRASRGHFKLYVSESILDEVRLNMEKKAGLSNAEVEEVISLVKEASVSCDCADHPEEEVKGACRDPNDEHVLASAIAHKVDMIITGDKDLLIPGAYKGIKILAPREFELQLVDLDL